MTAEPELRFVLHDHAAKHHHVDLRLEREGVLKSWAIPKGLPKTSGERRLAIAVDDHDLAYIGFLGTIPEGEYGAGTVKIADTGCYDVLVWTDDRIEIILNGAWFHGKYILVRFKKAGEKEWLVMKGKD
jgi:DNA ligase D-like protein (predicted 3'-phosphoesterase)